jgi:hypothetical protein
MYMTLDSEAASLSKDQRVSGPLAWVGEGGLCDKVQSTCSGDPPHPLSPQLPTSQTKVIALNWQLKKEGRKGVGGGGRVDSWTDTTLTCSP